MNLGHRERGRNRRARVSLIVAGLAKITSWSNNRKDGRPGAVSSERGTSKRGGLASLLIYQRTLKHKGKEDGEREHGKVKSKT